MGALASGLQSIGQSASDFGQAKFDYADWRQRQQSNQLNNIIQTLRIQQIQRQLAQPQVAQFSDIKTGADGRPYGLNSLTGKIEAVPTPQGVTFPLAGEANPLNKLIADGTSALLRGDTATANKMFEAVRQAKAAETAPPKPPTAKPPQIKYDAGIPVAIEDGTGNTWDINDPKLPANLKPLVASASAAHAQHIKEQEQGEVRRGTEMLSRAEQLTKMREDAKNIDRTDKLSFDALGAKGALELAKQHAARKEAFSDLSMIYLAIRANVKDAGRMTQTEVMQMYNAGSMPDVWARRWERAIKGTLPQQDRDEVLHLIEDGYRAKRSAADEAWQQYKSDKPRPDWLKKSPEELDAEDVDGWNPKKK